MNLRALNYFVKLSDLRHFSKAAEACFVSQPTLSTQIRKLEEELGVQLVERAPRRVMLTPVGEEIADRARGVLRDIRQIRDAASRSKDPAAGTLRLGIFPTLAPYLLPHVVPGLRQRYPDLRLQLSEEKTGDIIRLLHSGSLDAALLALPLDDESLEMEVLFQEPFVLALPASHPIAEREEICLDDLAGTELLLLEDGHCLREHALEVCSLAGARERADAGAGSQGPDRADRQYDIETFSRPGTEPHHRTGMARQFRPGSVSAGTGRQSSATGSEFGACLNQGFRKRLLSLQALQQIRVGTVTDALEQRC
jgi:LysR family hydrogen peroxide-inducible transcriptional activator